MAAKRFGVFTISLFLFLPPSANAARSGSGHSTVARLVERLGSLPLNFEPNRGQTDPRVRFLARAPRSTLFLAPDEVVLALSATSTKKAILRIKPRGANRASQLEGLEELPGRSNYFIGSDPKKWKLDVPHYARVRYGNLYPGIDLVFSGGQGQLEYDFLLAPGADPTAIRLDFEGAERLTIEANGDLTVFIAGVELRQRRPKVYQERGGIRREIGAAHVLMAKNRVAFRIDGYDPSRPLIIDPELVYSTYLGGSDDDFGVGVAADSAGNAYVAGVSFSVNFPTADARQAANAGRGDAFVAKINTAGSALLLSTYLGGADSDGARAIALDSSGNILLFGNTNSDDFPRVSPIQAAKAGGTDAFVAKLNAAGNSLIYSTYLGGAGTEQASGIALDPAGNAYVTGRTLSTDFPTANAFQAANAGAGDAFVAKINTTGSALVYSTYLGGAGDENGKVFAGIAVDSSGNAYVTGQTASTNFPTKDPLQATGAGVDDAFVAKLNATGNVLLYSTYLGGSSSESGSAIALDASGNIYLVGQTSSTNFPTKNPFQATIGGGQDAFFVKLNAAGNAILYSTYLGGSSTQSGLDLALDPAGNAYVVGQTTSVNFPTKDALQTTLGGGNDAFVAKMNPSQAGAASLLFSSYLGGSGTDTGQRIALDRGGSIYLTGLAGAGFPTKDAFQAGFGGGVLDAFLAKIFAGTLQIVPAVGSTPGALGSLFKTAVQLHNPGSTPIAGSIVYHPQAVSGSSGDPSLPYSLAPGQTQAIPDLLAAMGQSGLGSADLLATTGQPPVFVARVFNDAGSAGTAGFTEEAMDPTTALQTGQRGVLIAPPDFNAARFNIGVRTLASGVAMTVTLRASSGTILKILAKSFPATFYLQQSALDFLEVAALSGSESLTFQITSGSAIIYGATADNKTQDPSVQIARRLP